MTEREHVIAMVKQVKGRLADLNETITAYADLGGNLEGIADRIDKVDDKLYLIESELDEKLAKLKAEHEGREGGSASVASDGSAMPSVDETSHAEGERTKAVPLSEVAQKTENKTIKAADKEDGILTDSAKKELKSVLSDSKAVIGEITSTMNELKDAFKFK